MQCAVNTLYWIVRCAKKTKKRYTLYFICAHINSDPFQNWRAHNQKLFNPLTHEI
jgi:hypothetical protein